MNKFEQWSQLALMRFFLSFVVAINHLEEYANLGALAVVKRFGAFEAILGFLIISGYSIGTSYKKSPDGFYKRRMQRLYPIYLASFVFYFFYMQPDFLSAPFLLTLAINLVFLNQALTSLSFVGPAWSLALEVWLYAFTPLFEKAKSRLLIILSVCSLAAYVVYTSGRTLFGWPYYSNIGFGVNFVTLSFPWILGFLLARQKAQPKLALWLIAGSFAVHIGLNAAIALASKVKHDDLGGFFAGDLPNFLFRAATLLVIVLLFRNILKATDKKRVKSHAMRVMGDISYPLYLIHIPIYAIAARNGLTNPYLLAGIAIVAAFFLYQALDFYSKRRRS